MWIKALWWKEYKQVKWLIWLFPLVNFLGLGLQRLDKWFLDDDRFIQQALRHVTDTSSAYNGGNLESTSRVLLTILLTILAGMIIGSERRNGVQEMTFALPYSRSQLFWTKWMLGFALIFSSVLVNTVIDMTIVLNSPISEYFHFRYHMFQLLYSCFILLSVYSTVLFIGTLSGSMASQMIFSIILAFFPIGLTQLIQQFLQVHKIGYSSYYSYGYRPFEQWMNNVSLLQYVHMDLEHTRTLSITVPALYLLIATIGGYAAYRWNKCENNGKLMLFPIGETVLKIGFVICTSLLGAAFLSSIFRNELASYYIGLLLSLVLSTILIRRLTRVRWKV